MAAGASITTVSTSLAQAAPPGVRVIAVRGGSQELRRIIVARLPGRLSERAAAVADALRTAARETALA